MLPQPHAGAIASATTSPVSTRALRASESQLLHGSPPPSTTQWVFVCLPLSFEGSFHRNRQDSSPLQHGSGALPSVKAHSCTALSGSCSHIPPALTRQNPWSLVRLLGHRDGGTTALSPRCWNLAGAGDVPPHRVCPLPFTCSI